MGAFSYRDVSRSQLQIVHDVPGERAHYWCRDSQEIVEGDVRVI